VVLKATLAGRLVGSVRGRMLDGACAVARLVVHPECQRRGIGSQLLRAIEDRFPEAERFELFTGDKSEKNIRLYERHGYRLTRRERVSPAVVAVFMEKLARGGGGAGDEGAKRY
jgi:ribosomal protein S18 acetylase RimI-like enzyme